MEPDRLIAVILLAVGAVLIEFGAACTASLASLPRHRRTTAEHPTPAAPVEWAVDNRERLEPALSVLQTAGLVLCSLVLARVIFENRGATWDSAAGTGVVAFLLLTFTQVSALALTLRAPERILRAGNLPLRLTLRLTAPVVALSGLFTTVLLRKPPPVQTPPDDGVQAVDAAVEEIGEDAGALEDRERTMIRNILDMEFTTVRAIMVPRLDVVACPAEEPLPAAVELVLRHGVSRIPIYEETIDHIVGVVYAKDLLLAMHVGRSNETLKALARMPYFVPESKRTDELLHDMLGERVHVAIVVDEYGGTSGLVSLEDLLEEIVGEIADEYDTGDATIETVSEVEALLDARVSIDDVNDALGTQLDSEDVDTVGGLVYAHLGRIPIVGDEVDVGDVRLTVERIIGRRIKQVRAVRRALEVAAEVEPEAAAEKSPPG